MTKGRKVPPLRLPVHGVRHNGNIVGIQTGLLPHEEFPTTAGYAYAEQRVRDLNRLQIQNHDGPAESLATRPVEGGGVTAYFRDLETRLIEHINDADAIVGCVAWLTNSAILEALAQKDPVSLVVQKEDFLRPDIGSGVGWAERLRRQYEKLSCSWTRLELGLHLSFSHDLTVDPVRCVGNYNRDKHPAFPRMHHKFVVFCKRSTRTEIVEYDEHEYEENCLRPYAVWTGSFNFTENAGRSLENALFITQGEIVAAYMMEWHLIIALSEPLDWQSDWCAPEWRLGT